MKKTARNLLSCTLLIVPLLVSALIIAPYSPASADTVSRGKDLYHSHCAICHAQDGHGGMGIPLSLDDFLSSASDDYLKKTIRLGRPGRIMPAFNDIPAADVDAIVAYINQWRKQAPPDWSQKPIKGDNKQGLALYTAHCAGCHGNTAQGGKGTGLSFSRQKDLPITAPALNNQGFLLSAPDTMLHHIIKHGRKGTPMPSAKQLGLNNQQINHLVSYIRSLQKKQVSESPEYEEPASLIVDSPYGFDETVENIKREIVGANFIHIRDQSLMHGYETPPLQTQQGTSAKGRHTIIYFCNFNFLYDSLRIDPRVGLFLPCRITVTEQNGKVQMMSINPKYLSQLFNNNELDQACEQMHELYSTIMEDASL